MSVFLLYEINVTKRLHQFRAGEFACNGVIHFVPDFLRTEVVSQKEHEFGYHTFYGGVVSADDTGIEQVKSGFVTCHLYHTGLTL